MNAIAVLAPTLALLCLACGSQARAGGSVEGLVDAENIGRLLTVGEVERGGRDGLELERHVVDLMARAVAEGQQDLDDVEAWHGLDFSERPDGSRLNLAVIDHFDAVGANARFEQVLRESGVIESDPGIGERFAGLSPRSLGLDTVVMFLVGDKTVLMTTTTALTDRAPVVAADGLVDLARLVASRLAP